MTRNRHGDKPNPFKPQPRKVEVFRNGVTATVTQPVTLRKEPVCWGIPMDELCFSLWFTNFIHLPVMPWDNMSSTISTYLPDARNAIHASFLKMPENVEWLVMLDSDVMPPPGFLDRLLSYRKPLVGGWYKRKGNKNEPVVYDYSHTDSDGVSRWKIREKPGQGLEKVDGIGAGILLMRRDLAEALGPKPYSMERGGEDLELCLRVKELGYEIFVDWSVACAHAGVGIT